MFGGKRRRATKMALEAVQPILRTLEMSGGIPSGFWDDPYVLGYLGGTAAIFAKMTTQGKIAGESLGQVMITVYETLSGLDGVEISKKVLLLQSSNDKDFLKGLGNADKTICVAYGIEGYEDDPDVVEAKELVKKMGPDFAFLGETTEAAQISGCLTQMLFYQVVRDRLGEAR